MKAQRGSEVWSFRGRKRVCEVWHAHKLFVGFGGQASSHPETCVGDGNRGSVLAGSAISCLPLVTVCSFGCRASAITGGGAELSRSGLVSLRSERELVLL